MIRPKIKPQFRPPLPGPKPSAPPGLLSNIPRPGILPPGMKPPVSGLLGILPPSVLERIKVGALLPAPAVPQGVSPQAATSESFQPVMQRVFDKIGVGNKVGQDNILKAIDTMSEIETNKQDIPNALGSSARGYFQYMVGNGCSEYATNAEGDSYCPKENKGTSENPVFKNSSFNTALNRVDNFYEKHNLGPVPEAFKKARLAKTPMGILTYEEQRLLAFIDAYAKKGTNAFFQRMSKGGDDGRKAIDEYYKEYHLTTAGTGGTQATETDKNRNKIITNKSNLIYNRNEPD